MIELLSVLIIVLGLIMTVYGYKIQTHMYLFFGSLLILSPIFYLIGWMFFLPMVPPMALLIAYLLTGMFKKVN